MKEYQNKDTVLPRHGDKCHHSRNAAIRAGKLQDGSQLGLHCEISSEPNTLAFSNRNNAGTSTSLTDLSQLWDLFSKVYSVYFNTQCKS